MRSSLEQLAGKEQNHILYAHASTWLVLGFRAFLAGSLLVCLGISPVLREDSSPPACPSSHRVLSLSHTLLLGEEGWKSHLNTVSLVVHWVQTMNQYLVCPTREGALLTVSAPWSMFCPA